MSSKLTANSVIERRETTNFFPSTSEAITVNNSGGSSQRVVNIRLSSPGYIDLQTACLEFEHKLTGGAEDSTDGVPDNHIASLIEEITLLVGGRRVEHIRDLGSVVNMLSLATETAGHRDHNGDFQGEWVDAKYSEGQDNTCYTGGADDGITAKIANRQNANKLYSPYNTDKGVAGNNGSGGNSTADFGYKSSLTDARTYRIPLSQLLGMFALPTYFPLRNCGNITIQIRFQDNLKRCLVNLQSDGGANAPADQTLPANLVSTISQLRVKTDIVYPSASYVSAVDNLLANDAVGAMFGVQTLESQDIDFTGTGGTSATAGVASTKSLVFTIGTRYLKGVYVAFRTKSDLDNASRLSLSAFPNMGFETARMFINGVSYPVNPIEGASQAYDELEKAMNLLGDVDRSNLIPYTHYLSNVSRSGEATNATVDYCGKFMLGFNLEQVLQSGRSLGGISTLAGGYNIRLEVENQGARYDSGNAGDGVSSAGVATAVFYKDVILQLRQNAVEVSQG